MMKSPRYRGMFLPRYGRIVSESWRLSDRRSLTPSSTAPYELDTRASTGETTPVDGTMSRALANTGRASSLVTNRGTPLKLRSRVLRWFKLWDAVTSSVYGDLSAVPDHARFARQLRVAVKSGAIARTIDAGSENEDPAPDAHCEGIAAAFASIAAQFGAGTADPKQASCVAPFGRPVLADEAASSVGSMRFLNSPIPPRTEPSGRPREPGTL